ncbi:MAG: 23S rRNA (pseudouridine(1915)-N(3))-methyltransferase RlmH [Cellvibrionales bacterium]|nr:23S rRNA (pseudouridine(1915)-N(3))-methyltransferase RlmH [Cellvibrionales bacterium]
MKLKIIAVGTRLPAWVQAGIDHFMRRIQPLQAMEMIEVPVAKRSKNTALAPLLAAEADAIERHLKGQEQRIALAVDGRACSSADLAATLAAWQMAGRDTALLLGGPDGLDPRFLAHRSQTLSLSALTLPHALARLVLVEQLYRALTLAAGHPYHRA